MRETPLRKGNEHCIIIGFKYKPDATIEPEIRISEQIVQVVREELEHKAEVVAPRVVVLQPDDVELVRGVGTVHQLEEPDLYLGLRIERGQES